MREIKFRAWNKNDKVMMTDINLLSSSQSSQAWISNNGEGGYFNPKSEKFIVMQFTGLLDKSGKEIYEGDILDNGKVKWDVDWVDRAEGREDGKVWGHAPDITGFRIPFDLEEFEVIGNIYENPDLLSKER